MNTDIKREVENANNPQPPKTILFTHYGDDWIRGSERCLLDLIKHLDKKQFTAVLWCNQPKMAQAAAELGITVHQSPFPILFGWQAPRFNFLAFFKLIKEALQLIKSHNIELIHANSAAPCQWLTFAAKQAKRPLICHLHSPYQFRDRLTLGLYQTEMVVGVSQYVVAPLLTDKKPCEQVSVIANGIDTKRLLAQKVINLRGTLNIEPNKFVIATLGSLIKRKGVDLLINATEKLLQNMIPVHLLVIGHGPELNNLKQQVKQLGLDNNVSFIGESDQAIGILRGTADLFVSAAREEAFGLVFAEASLANLAIVAPHIGGIPDVVINNKSGLLISPENITALVNAITQLYLNPLLCSNMAKAGQQHIYNKFTIEKNAALFQRLYHKQLTHYDHQQNLSKTVKTIRYLLKNLAIKLTEKLNIVFNNRIQNAKKRGCIHE